MTFNVVSWKGVSMPEVTEPIRMIRLTATRNRKVYSQISSAPNDKLAHAGMNNRGFEIVDMAEIPDNAVSILCISIYFSICLLGRQFKQRLKPKMFLFFLEIRIWVVICTMDFSLTGNTPEDENLTNINLDRPAQ